MAKKDHSTTDIVLSNPTNPNDKDTDSLVGLLELLPDKTVEYLKKNKPKINLYVQSFINGFSGSIIICNDNCPYGKRCPFIENDNAPIGSFCPLEIGFMYSRVEKYIASGNFTDQFEILKVNELVSLELIENRLKAMIANDGIIYDQVIGVGAKSESIIYGPQLNPLLTQLTIIGKKKDDLAKSLNLFKKTNTKDTDNTFQEMVNQMEQVK